ncbi:MAG: ATP-binding protein [Actinobacteria bacterium]|nr:ATP-binding protein [Actinomycetota bacterium]
MPLPAPPSYRTRSARARSWASLASRLEAGPWVLVRAFAVVSVPLLALWLDATVDPLAVGGLALWVIASSIARSPRATAVLDAVLGAALVFVTGDVVTPYVLYVLTSVAGAGMTYGGVTGAAAGAVVSLTRVAAFISAGTLGRQSDDLLLTSLALFPLTGLAAGMTVEVLRRRRSGRYVLEEANQLLVDLHRVAGAIPGGLDVATVAGAALEEIGTIEPPSFAVVFSGDDHLLHAVAPASARATVPSLSPRRLDSLVGSAGHRLCTSQQVEDEIGLSTPGQPHWLVVPLRSRRATVGAFAVAYDDVSAARRARRDLVALAADTALALDNARLLGATTRRAADAARRRIARDLHDSVAQSLAHLKMELELLTLTGPGSQELHDETTRLARVAGRALDDVRATITGLRSDVVEDGLVTALRRHVEDLRSPGGPRLTFETLGSADVDAGLASDLLHVAQEAISNAVRHAHARHVTVSLEIDDKSIELVIEDDGRGMPATIETRPENGVGLRAMQERASAVGGQVTLRPRVGGGTVVMLRCPSTRTAPLRRRSVRRQVRR